MSNVGMTFLGRQIPVRRVLPYLQLLLALVLFFYGPFQYRAAIRKAGGGVGVEFDQHNWPPPARRILLSLNFPAQVAMTPFNLFHWLNRDVYRYEVKGGEFSITIWDLGFFSCIWLLWYGVGRTVDLSARTYFGRGRGSRSLPTIITACGFLFGLCVCLLACYWLSSAPGYRQVAPFGLAWSAVLLGYFGWRLATTTVLVRRRASSFRDGG